ncbi:IclR family transcriptional regulator [Ramlibacter sp.]|uniref:IclR family transcriptional regulator n=1 Tax=Ramlibacter sp. TaxID=1917967 RepID=UPI003D0D98BF
MQSQNIENDDGASGPTAGSALVRGIRILQAFTAETPALTARQLMEATQLPKPSLFRLATTLVDIGLLRYDEPTGQFRPAPAVARLAEPLLARTTLRQLAFGPMQTLADRVCGQVSLALGLGHDLVFIELAQSKSCLTVRPAMGSHISLARTATGRAYLLSLPDEQMLAYVADVAHRDPKQGAWLDERLREAQRDLDERGFCVSYGDLHRDLQAVAVPLRSGHDTNETFVFGCTVPAFELGAGQLLDEVGPRLTSLARSMEAALGTAQPAAV